MPSTLSPVTPLDLFWTTPHSPSSSSRIGTEAHPQPRSPRSSASPTMQASEGCHYPYMETINIHNLVHAVCLSPDGTHFICAGEDGLIQIFDFDSRHLVAVLKGHAGAILTVRMRGGLLVSGGTDGSLRVWEFANGQLLMALHAHGKACTSVDVCNDRFMVVSGSEDGSIKVWSLDSGVQMYALEGHKDGAICLEVSQSHGWIVSSASNDTHLCLWDITTGHLLKRLTGHSMPVTSVAIDGARIVSGSLDGSVRVWDAEVGQLLRNLDRDGQEISCVHICGERIAAATLDMMVHVWDAETGQHLRGLKGSANSYASSLCLYKGRVVSSNNNLVHIWDTERGQLGRELGSHSGFVSSVCATSGYIISAGHDKAIRVFQPEGGHLLRTLKDNEAIAAIHVADGHIVSAGTNENVKVWNLKTGQVMYTIRDQHPQGIKSVCKSGDRLVTGSSDNIVRVFRADNGQFLFNLEDHTDAINCVYISDGRIVSGSDDGTLHVYEASDGEHLGILLGHTHWVQSCAMCCGWIVSGSADKTVRIWDADSGENLMTLHGHTQTVTSVHMSEDRAVVSGSSDQTVKVWNGANGQLLKTLETRDMVTCVCINNGRILAGSSHGYIRIWDDYLNFPSPTDYMSMQESLWPEAEDIASIFHPAMSGQVLLENIEVDQPSAGALKHRRNVLLHTVSHIHQRHGDRADWRPLISLLHTKPEIAFAAQPLDQALGLDASGRCETLLFLAITRVNNADLVCAVLSALAKALSNEGSTICKSLEASFLGLPYQYIEDLQLALEVYPLLASEAMGNLWDLVKGPPRVERRHLGANSYVTQGSAQPYCWVWDDNDEEGGDLEDNEHHYQQQPQDAPPVPPAIDDSSLSYSSPLKRRLKEILGGHAKIYTTDDTTTTSSLTPATSCYPDQLSMHREPRPPKQHGETAPIVEAWLVPLPNPCGIGPASFLATCLKLSEAQGHCAIFEKPVVEAVLEFKWQHYYWRFFFPLGALSILLALNFSMYTYFGSSLGLRAKGIWTIVLVANGLPLLLYETMQAIIRPATASGYLSNGWNFFDMCTYGGLAAVLVLSLQIPRGSSTYILSGLVALMLWFKLLYFFRGVRAYSTLIRAVFRATADIKYFLLILFVCLAGFTNAFYMITQLDLFDYHDAQHPGCNDDGGALSCMHDAFGNGYTTFLSLFSAMTGNYDLGLFQASSVKVLPQSLYVLYIVLHAIILLNILIAIMGDSYDNVQQMARGEWRSEQARIIQELEDMLSVVYKHRPELLESYQPQWLHVLREAGKKGGAEDEWGGRVRAIGKEVRKGVEEGLLADTKMVIKSMEADLVHTRELVRSNDKDLGQIKASLDSLILSLSNEMAELRAVIAAASSMSGESRKSRSGDAKSQEEDTRDEVVEEDKPAPLRPKLARRSTTMRRRSTHRN